MKKVRLLKNGRYAGYLKQKDGSWKWSFISNKIGGYPNNNYETLIGNLNNNNESIYDMINAESPLSDD